MIIQVKTMKGEAIELNVIADNKISEIKGMIHSQKGHEPEAQKLIFRGKHLEDSKSLGDYNIKEKDSLVLMVSKQKTQQAQQPAPAPAPAPQPPVNTPPVQTQPAPAQNQQVLPNPPQPNPVQPAPAQAAPIQQPPSQTQQGSPGMSAQMQEMVNNIMAMGFEKEQVEIALRAAFNNPDRAIDYLVNGIPPEVLQQQIDAHQGMGGMGGGGGMPPSQPNPTGNPNPAPNLTEGDPESNYQIDENTMAEIEALIQNPAFIQLRAQARQNPQIIPQIFNLLQTVNPNLHQFFSERPQLFIAILMGDLSSGEGGQGGPPGGQQGGQQGGQNVIRLSAEENAAIER